MSTLRDQREASQKLDELERFITNQNDEVVRLKAKMRGALAALQTGTAIDVVAAIEILKSGVNGAEG